jgi:hypothetical protein
MMDRQAELDECLKRINDEGGGVYCVLLIMQSEMPGLAEMAARGDAPSKDKVFSVLSYIAKLDNGAEALCVTCNKPLGLDVAGVGWVCANTDIPATKMSFGVCGTCGTDKAAAWAGIKGKVATMFGNYREINITHPEGGHA